MYLMSNGCIDAGVYNVHQEEYSIIFPSVCGTRRDERRAFQKVYTLASVYYYADADPECHYGWSERNPEHAKHTIVNYPLPSGGMPQLPKFLIH